MKFKVKDTGGDDIVVNSDYIIAYGRKTCSANVYTANSSRDITLDEIQFVSGAHYQIRSSSAKKLWEHYCEDL